MRWKHTPVLGVTGALVLALASLSAMARGEAADEPQSASQPQEKQVEAAQASSATAPDEGQYRFLNDGGWDDPSQGAVRFGYWGTHTSGSPVKVGEYQDLGASPFYDVDGIRSDGQRTLNYTITGTDAESNAATLNFYRPGIEANVDYLRYPHQLLHENLGEFPNFDTTGSQQFRRQDVNAGDDYAIRVQEVKANFKCKVSDILKVRLDVWGMKKEGEHEARAMQECYAHTNGVAPEGFTGTKNCHVLSQMQHIDWETTEVKPIVELNLGAVVFEYSRPMRLFTQADQNVYRYYDSGGIAASEFGESRFMEYGAVPNSDTQIDQLKISAELDEYNRFYSFLFAGNTNKRSDIAAPYRLAGETPFDPLPSDERISNRQFSGAEVRWTSTAIENVSITTYGRTVGENNEPATFLIPGEETRPGTVGSVSVPIEDDPTQITPINYQRSQVGTRAVWRPFGRGFGLGGLAINGGYEFSFLHRAGLEVDTGSDDPPFEGTIIEERTTTHIFTIGPSVRWSPELDTYLRYKWCNTQDPLFATNSHQSVSGGGTTYDYRAVALNSALPTHADLIELGGTFMPSDRFMVNAWVGIDIQSQNIGRAIVEPGTTTVVPLNVPLAFASQSFPFGVNASYRVTDLWTLNGGAAYYTNFIDQDVTFGAGADHGFAPYGLLVNQWGYSSQASVFNVGSSYDLTCRVRLIGQAEYVKGIQYARLIAGDPRYPELTATLAGIPENFRQDIASTRLSAGVDYRLSSQWSGYVRYVLYNYEDSADQARIANSTQPVNGLPLSGTSNMFLGGVTGMF